MKHFNLQSFSPTLTVDSLIYLTSYIYIYIYGERKREREREREKERERERERKEIDNKEMQSDEFIVKDNRSNNVSV